ncbi:MAG: DUF433 domain-containing protein [Thermomicrobiales bacterium]
MAIPHAEPRTIIKNPRVLHAEPILDGTRIPVRTVVLLMRLYGDIAAVQRELSILTIRDVEAALHYYDAHRDEIEYWIAFDSADSDGPL